jgi:hypothetical protein
MKDKSKKISRRGFIEKTGVAATSLAILPVAGISGFGVRAGMNIRTEDSVLPGTQPLSWDGPLDVKMREGVNLFLDERIARSVEKRTSYWNRNFSNPQSYENSVAPNRENLKKIIGVVDQRLPASMERFGDSDCPSLVSETSRYGIFQVRWPVLKNADDAGIVYGEGLLIEPNSKPLGYVVAIPDADNNPEEIAGLSAGLLPQNHYARRLAENGC